ncbi:N-acetyltransferase GCN5 [Paraburkholderia hospita]|uniref:N-acetyltransferase GCN5 n=1 Tax=Paraburkholderia hospita TaxID=169430 RepID=A0ABN0FDW7_9BURK|nr:GNAT family N-acetyltransferase [Paraburkholderia hospita]EIM96842.1 N-acetyltransferase GCN5 [Paraburkholderia hospita]OUL68911.1 GNAT family N-acetyltransferase [Paraburkholderia hospita]OUL86696.1 GNAT family N-acetyltransferase [Paraburkholderia hospita]
MTDPIPFAFRLFRAADAAALAALFHDAALAAAGYDPAAREAWASAADDLATFGARLSRGITLVALRGGAYAGFGQLHPADHIEMLYVAPAFMRQGLAAELLARLEAPARAAGALGLTADVSVSARHAFERAGFAVEAEESVTRNGVSLRRFRMMKPLAAARPQV